MYRIHTQAELGMSEQKQQFDVALVKARAEAAKHKRALDVTLANAVADVEELTSAYTKVCVCVCDCVCAYVQAPIAAWSAARGA